MFPCRYGRRNVVNRCGVVLNPCDPVFVVGGGVGLLVQILGSGRGFLWVGVGDKPSAY